MDIKKYLLRRMRILFETYDGLIDPIERAVTLGAIEELQYIYVEIVKENVPSEQIIRADGPPN